MKSSKKITVEIINGFVDNGEGGNPADVALNADELSNEDKQRIAAYVGLWETAFEAVCPDADFKLEFLHLPAI